MSEPSRSEERDDVSLQVQISTQQIGMCQQKGHILTKHSSHRISCPPRSPGQSRVNTSVTWTFNDSLLIQNERPLYYTQGCRVILRMTGGVCWWKRCGLMVEHVVIPSLRLRKACDKTRERSVFDRNHNGKFPLLNRGTECEVPRVMLQYSVCDVNLILWYKTVFYFWLKKQQTSL